MKRRWLYAAQDRGIGRAVASGTITAAMGDNRRAMIRTTRTLRPWILLLLIIQITVFMAMIGSWVPIHFAISTIIIVNIAMFALFIMMLIMVRPFSKFERRLRQDAVLQGRLPPRMIDRLWLRRQGRAITKP